MSVKINPNILENVLDNSHKQKADGSIDCCYCKAHVSAYIRYCKDLRDVEGDRQARLEEYCTWGLAQVESSK
jgi:hypothetical protein